MKMLREMLFLHWKSVRWPLAPITLLTFGMPMFVTRMMQIPREFGYGSGSYAADLVQMEQNWLPMFPLIAVAVGVTIALTAWTWDHQGRHVYALSLPVTRARYATTKMLAGAILLGVPIVAFLAGSLIGSALTKLPPELHSYPFSFSARFALASLVMYSATFALASTTVRTTAVILVGLLVFVMFGTMLVSFIESALHTHGLISPAELVYDALMNWPGPFSVFGGSWLLIDA